MKQTRLLMMFILAGTVAVEAAEPLAADFAASPFENRENAATKKKAKAKSAPKAKVKVAAPTQEATSGIPKQKSGSIGALS
ncbi:MAG: hypothetical protein IPJ84_06030 [Bdellovibrionales bacterium]|nr:hypothetical protein [Bdellovibrionales bacterium]